MHIRSLAAGSIVLFTVGASPAPVTAQSFPAKPVRFIVPVAAGGNLDLVTRSVAQKLTEQIGRTVIVENRAGSSGVVGTEYVARSAADGYTYLSIATTFTSVPAFLRGVTYDPIKDFAGVSLMAWLPNVLVVNPSLPVRSVRELIALAKRQPEALTYGSAGVGAVGHIAAALFTMQADIRMTHVPYKGNAPALMDVLGGQISLMFDTISTSVPYIKSGKLKALGVTSLKRSALIPDLPTVSEAGVPGYEAILFNAIVAPAGTPSDIRARMHSEIAKAVRNPEIANRFLEQGVELMASESADQCTAFVKSEVEKYAKLVKQAGITPE